MPADRTDGQAVYEAWLRAGDTPFHDMWNRISERERGRWEAYAATLPAEKLASDRAYPNAAPSAPAETAEGALAIIRDYVGDRFSEAGCRTMLREVLAAASPAETPQTPSETVHRLRIEFERDTPWPSVSLICPPGNEGCAPATCECEGTCPSPCGVAPCWAATWPLHDLDETPVIGAVEVPVDIHAEGYDGYPVFTLRPASVHQEGEQHGVE